MLFCLYLGVFTVLLFSASAAVNTFDLPKYWPEDTDSLKIDATATNISISVDGLGDMATLAIVEDQLIITCFGTYKLYGYGKDGLMTLGPSFSSGGTIRVQSQNFDLVSILIGLTEREPREDKTTNTSQDFKAVLIQCRISNGNPFSSWKPPCLETEHKNLLDTTLAERKNLFDKTLAERKNLLDKTVAERKNLLDETLAEHKNLLHKTLAEARGVPTRSNPSNSFAKDARDSASPYHLRSPAQRKSPPTNDSE